MPVTDVFERRACDTLFVNREARQRQDLFTAEGEFINADGLLESVRERGVLSPLLVTRGGEIIFGERRWVASQLAGRGDVPVRYVEDIPKLELRILELEENIRRKDLNWRDKVITIAHLHETYCELNGESWAQVHTAQALNLATSQISEMLRVYEDLGSPKIALAQGVRQAYNVLTRIDQRVADDIIEDIAYGATDVVMGHIDDSEPPGSPVAPGDAGGHPTTDHMPSSHGVPAMPATSPILQESFLTWAATYSGPRFNLIHCDYPYGSGTGPQTREQVAKATAIYEDSPKLYEDLIKVLCANLDRLMSASAHLVFWLNADYKVHKRTREMFRDLAPSIIFWERPLIWNKTDHVSVIADASRYARNCYETALVGAREDRKIIKAVSNCYGAPTDKKWHPSTKPEPMLRHFFQMFVDTNTRLLDPTCGSASALRAAESLGASQVLGLEADAEHAKNASIAMRQFRSLRAIA